MYHLFLPGVRTKLTCSSLKTDSDFQEYVYPYQVMTYAVDNDLFLSLASLKTTVTDLSVFKVTLCYEYLTDFH